MLCAAVNAGTPGGRPPVGGIEIRRGYEPGLIGRAAELHGRYYAEAWGSGAPFESLIAREFGGGGHPHAAGGFFRFSLWDKILLRFTKKNRYFPRISAVADQN